MPSNVRFRPAAALLIAGLLALTIVAPGAARAADPVFPPASRVGMVPPPGFMLSTTFAGYTHTDKQANILVAELPGYAFDNIEKEIADELARNPAAGNRSDIELKDGGRGFVLNGTQHGPQGPVSKWTMIAKVHDVTAVVTALVPEAVAEAASDAAIRSAFATLTVRVSVPVEEQLAVLPFSLRELAGFRILRVQPHAAVMLTDGPKDVIEAAEQPLLLMTLGGSPDQPRPEERESLARRLMGETPGLKDMKVVRSGALRIANQQGHEILVEAKDGKSGTEVQAVQWLRFGSGTLLRIVGVARKDGWDATFSRFRQVRDGLGPK